MLKVGCAEKVFQVPLFAELYGYGPFAGRRNLGVHDDLYIRAFFLNDGEKQVLIVYTDCCCIDDLYCREMRAKLVAEFGLDPNGIVFVATHTHSAPYMGPMGASIGWGEAHPQVYGIWQKSVLEVAQDACLHTEEIASIYADEVTVTDPIGFNRDDGIGGTTDPVIRWMAFKRADGSTKLLIHNHGVHGTSMNGCTHRLVSADWMGAANDKIKQAHLADMPLFLLGACGDVNPATENTVRNCDDSADLLGNKYVDQLKKSLSAGGRKVDCGKLSYAFQSVEFPVVRKNVTELEAEARDWENFARTHENPLAVEFYRNFVRRIEEMIVLVKMGKELRSFHDFQVVQLGSATFFFVPGEFFIEPGLELLKKAKAEHAFLAEVSNGSASYFPSKRIMKKYPSIAALNSKEPIWGFYEVYEYMHGLKFKYQDNIADFVIDHLLAMEK